MLALALSLALLAGAGADAGAPYSFRPEEAPPALAPAVSRADAAVKALRERLQARLQAELRSGGPRAALAVCRAEAPAIAAAVERETGVAVGRTSARLRNPANAPRPWVKALVEETAGAKLSAVPARAVDLGDRVGLLRPIGVAGACLACHGPAERIAPDVKAALGESYPQDRATGYAEGDLRGFFWAEARR